VRQAERAVLVGIVVAVAAALRWGFVATATVHKPLRADAGEYARYAANLAEHGVFSLAATVPPPPDSFRSPGYPFVLAVCRWLGGENGWYALAIGLQVALGTLTVLLCYRLARQLLGFGPALLAAAACAASPHLVVAPAYVLTECVTTFVVTAGLWITLGATSAVRRAAGAAVLGLAVLCNESLLFLPFVALAATWRNGRRAALACAAMALLPFAAWSVRNAAQPLARHGSERAVASVSHGSYPGMVFRDPRWFGYPYREDPAQPAMAASWGSLWAVLGPRTAAEPWRYAGWYLLEKPVWLWGWNLVQGRDVLVYEVANSPYERQPVMAASHALMRVLHAPLMLAAALTAVAAVLLRRRVRWELWALGATAVVGTLAYLPVIPDPRYLQPVRPLLFVLAACGLASCAAWVGARVRARRVGVGPVQAPVAAPAER
jgi:4-amino-4-deoxy-L-arabinose transferase-like glycosyltransferase